MCAEGSGRVGQAPGQLHPVVFSLARAPDSTYLFIRFIYFTSYVVDSHGEKIFVNCNGQCSTYLPTLSVLNLNVDIFSDTVNAIML